MTPFYKKALALFTKTQQNQIFKGLDKYPEPFNPHDWTPEELLNHALEEVVDTTHYLVGLKELLDVKDKEILRLKSLLAKVPADVLAKAYDKVQLQEDAEYVYSPTTGDPLQNFMVRKPTSIMDLNLFPKYFDPDDQ